MPYATRYAHGCYVRNMLLLRCYAAARLMLVFAAAMLDAIACHVFRLMLLSPYAIAAAAMLPFAISPAAAMLLIRHYLPCHAMLSRHIRCLLMPCHADVFDADTPCFILLR